MFYLRSNNNQSEQGDGLFFPNWDFSQYIINIAGSEAAIGEAGGRAAPILLVNVPKKTGARSALET